MINEFVEVVQNESEINAAAGDGFRDDVQEVVSEAPLEPAPVPEAPTEPVPAPEAPTEPVPAPEVPTEPVPVPEAPTDPVPAPEAPTDLVPAPEAPMEPVPAPEAPTEPVPGDSEDSDGDVSASDSSVDLGEALGSLSAYFDTRAQLQDTSPELELAGIQTFALSPIISSPGLKGILLDVLGPYDNVVTQYKYQQSNNSYYTYVNEITPDYPWIASAVLFIVLILSLFRLVGRLGSWMK